jgi:hypothetical protein
MVSAKPWTARWEGEAAFEAAARLLVDAPGLPAGAPVTFEVEQVGAGVVATIEATAGEGRAEATFSAWYDPGRVAPAVEVAAPGAFPPVAFSFTARAGGRVVRAAPLVYADRLHAQLLSTGEEQPLARQAFVLRSPWGTYRGESDDQGIAVVEGLPPGGVYLLVDEELGRERA